MGARIRKILLLFVVMYDLFNERWDAEIKHLLFVCPNTKDSLSFNKKCFIHVFLWP
jgi:hypothetical protein